MDLIVNDERYGSSRKDPNGTLCFKDIKNRDRPIEKAAHDQSISRALASWLPSKLVWALFWPRLRPGQVLPRANARAAGPDELPQDQVEAGGSVVLSNRRIRRPEAQSSGRGAEADETARSLSLPAQSARKLETLSAGARPERSSPAPESIIIASGRAGRTQASSLLSQRGSDTFFWVPACRLTLAPPKRTSVGVDLDLPHSPFCCCL